MMTNREVIQAWAQNRTATAQHLHTDGRTLFSYSLVVGVTVHGHKILFPVRGKHRTTTTTSHHVSMAEPYADFVLSPEAAAALLREWTSGVSSRGLAEFAEGYALGELVGQL